MFKMNKLTVACQFALMTSASMMTFSQAAIADEAEAEKDVEIIEVKGYRASELKARDLKKDAVGVVDAIIAEDIGKMPDENIAEALQRMTGVAITRSNGEGSQVSIRGMGAALNRISVNGKTLTSAGDDQAVGLEAFSSGLLERVEVFKTPSASMAEGSLGGSINLKTRRALDSKGRKVSASLYGDYSELSEEWDPKASLNYIDQSENRKFGFAGSLNYEQKHLRQDGFEVFGYLIPTSVTGEKNGAKNLITDASEGPISSLPADHPDRFVNGVDIGPYGAARPKNFNYRQYQQLRERLGGSMTFEFRFDNSLDIVLDATYSKLDVEQERYQFSVGPNYINPETMVLNENNTIMYGDTYLTDEFGNPDLTKSSSFNSNNSWSIKESETRVIGLEFEKGFDRLTIEGAIGHSITEHVTPESFRLTFNNAANEDKVPWSYDLSKGDLPEITAQNDGFNDPTRYKIQAVTSSTDLTTDEESVAQLDFDYDLEWGMFYSLEFGARYVERTKDRVSDAPRFTRNADGVDGFNWEMRLSDEGVAGEFPFDNYMAEVSGNNIYGWQVAQLEPALAAFGTTKEELQQSDLSVPDPLKSYVIEEESKAVYVMTNFESDDEAFAGNLGVRFVESTTQSTGGVNEGEEVVIKNFHHDYTNVLPSFNLRYTMTDEFLMRLGIGRVMSRPTMGEVAPRLTISTAESIGKVRGGNPYLEPYVSDQLDVSFEYYMGKSGLASIGFFYKDIQDYIQRTTTVGPVIDPATGSCILDGDGSGECKDFQITRPENGPSAEVQGAEVSLYRDLDFLPGFLSNFSVKLNYTYTDSDAVVIDPGTGEVVEDAEFPLQGMSKHTGNATIAYESENFAIRASTNYRSEYLSSAFGSQNNTQYVNEYYQTDLSASFNLTKGLKLTAQIINLTDEEKTAYFDQMAYWEQLGTTERLKYYNADGRRFKFGISGSF